MSKIDEVRADMVKAMKAGEKEKKDTLSLLLTAPTLLRNAKRDWLFWKPMLLR